MSDGILRFSNAEGVTALNRYHNFLTNYGDFGALQRIGFATATGSQNQIQFSNIPQTFQDLMVVVFARTGAGNYESLRFSMNGLSGSIFSTTFLRGNGSAADSGRETNSGAAPILGRLSFATNVWSSTVAHVLNYANTTTNKTMIGRSAVDQNGSGEVWTGVGLVRSTAAITSLEIRSDGTNYTAGSTFALYGVRASAA